MLDNHLTAIDWSAILLLRMNLANVRITIILEDDEKVVTYQAIDRAAFLIGIAMLPATVQVCMDEEAKHGFSMKEERKGKE